MSMEEKEQEEQEEQEEQFNISIEYGDIIEIIAPMNPNLHENAFFVNYIDESKIKIINLSTKEFIQLNMKRDGNGLTDESITQINLLDRSADSGFACQKG